MRVFQGTTWIPSHGEVVGFVSTPLPKSWKTWLLVGALQDVDVGVRAGGSHSHAGTSRAALVLADARSVVAQSGQVEGGLVVSEPAVYLTFDDGPDPQWTPRVLDAARAGASARNVLRDRPARSAHPIWCAGFIRPDMRSAITRTVIVIPWLMSSRAARAQVRDGAQP